MPVLILGLWLMSGMSFGGLLYGHQKTKAQLELPTPSKLKKDVAFWESIFRKYKSHQCVLHDSWDLSIVYDVANISHRSRKVQNRKIKKARRRIVRLLKRFSKGHKPKKRWEKNVYRSVPYAQRNPRFFRKALKRVRCQRGIADRFAHSLKRSKRHLSTIAKEIKRQELPVDLAYLPHLESGFNNRAHSKVGAKGLWQIMPKTGRKLFKRGRDHRTHVRKATRFALGLLKRNYRKTKSWPLAVTAYNYGINGTLRAIKKYNTRNYMVIRKRHKTRLFRFAARNFYPSFLAVRNLADKHTPAPIKRRQRSKS